MAPNPAKEKVKGFAEKFFSKLADSLDSDKDDRPPRPPAKPPHANSAPSNASSSYQAQEQNPFPNFGNITIHDITVPNVPLAHPNAPFVGGFHPAMPAYGLSPTSAHHSSSAPNIDQSSRPAISMPIPSFDYPQQQSLTMQMALQPPDAPRPPRAHSNPVPFESSKPHASVSAGPPPGRPAATKPASSPATPIRPTRSNSGSAVSGISTPLKAGQEQCSGVTKAGKRCTRKVKARPQLVSVDSDDSETAIPIFCHQHSKELMTPSGYYARKNGEWVKFEDWIPAYLQADTQVSLRVEMEKARTQSDVPGYIYAFEIRENREGETIKLKVGRAVNLVKRIDQWGKQCGSKEQVLRGFYPGSVEPDEASLMKGRVIAGEKGPWCHRLERLIHLELADIASTCVYLQQAWPNTTDPTSSATLEAKAKDSSTAAKPCPDCGSMHKEIFEFKRWSRGKHKGKEWEDLVKPIIDRWGKFVELYV